MVYFDAYSADMMWWIFFPLVVFSCRGMLEFLGGEKEKGSEETEIDRLYKRLSTGEIDLTQFYEARKLYVGNIIFL